MSENTENEPGTEDQEVMSIKDDDEIVEIPDSTGVTQRIERNQEQRDNKPVVRIKWIRCENFMTYTDCEYRPGSGLNVICGPNGTGKSSLSSAICIGLGGKPSLTGRSNDLKAYIKHGTTNCMVEICFTMERANTTGKPDIRSKRIKRELTLKKSTLTGGAEKSTVSSKYYIASGGSGEYGESKSSDDVDQFKAKHGINLENLCQYLPQDRVKEFACQKPQELLVNAEKALDAQLFNEHCRLNKYGEDLIDYNSREKELKRDIIEYKAQNSALETDVRLAKHFKIIQKKMRKLERAENVKLFARANELLIAQKSIVKELEEEVEDAEEDLQRYSRVRAKDVYRDRGKSTFTKESDTRTNKLEAVQDEIDTATHKMQARVKVFCDRKFEEENRAILITTKRYELREKEEGLESAVALAVAMLDVPHDELVRYNVQYEDSLIIVQTVIAQRLQQMNAQIEKLKDDHEQYLTENDHNHLKRKIDQANKAISQIKMELDEIENHDNRVYKKLNNIEIYKRAYKFMDVLHTANDEKPFQGRYIGPLAADISTQDQRSANIIESLIPKHQLSGIFFEKDEDRLRAYDLAGRGSVRAHQVNLYTIQPKKPDMSSGQAEELGFSGTLVDRVKMDAMVQSHYSGILSMPYREACGEEIPARFSDNYLLKHNIRSSFYYLADDAEKKSNKTDYTRTLQKVVEKAKFYSGAASTSNMMKTAKDIVPEKTEILSDQADAKKIEQKQHQETLNELQFRLERLEHKSKETQAQVAELHVERERIDSIKREISKATRDLDAKKEDLDKLQTTKIDIVKAKTELTRQLSEFLERIRELTEKHRFATSTLGSEAVKENLRFNEVSFDGFKLATKLADKEEAEECVRLAIEEKFNGTKEQQRLQGEFNKEIEKLMEKDGGFDLLGKGLDKKEIRETLHQKVNEEMEWLQANGWVDDPNGIREAKAQAQREFRRGAHIDDEVIDAYDATCKTIQMKQDQLGHVQQDRAECVEKNKDILLNWKGTLERYMETVNEHFTKYFSDMGCAGRVVFGPCAKPGQDAVFGDPNVEHFDENDYNNYGIMIYVNFRKNTKLKLLTGSTQSGGEKSVSTMLFLLAMQPISSCPFRLIDEINQGMDNRNERMIFQALAKTAESSNTQYFLITPKILEDLPYSQNITVGIVHNGIFAKQLGTFLKPNPADPQRPIQGVKIKNSKIDMKTVLNNYRARAAAMVM